MPPAEPIFRACRIARGDGAVRAWRERGRQLKRGMVRRRVDRAQTELGPTASGHEAERGGRRGHRSTAVLPPLEHAQRGARLREVAPRNRRLQLRAGSPSSAFGVLVRDGDRVRVGARVSGLGLGLRLGLGLGLGAVLVLGVLGVWMRPRGGGVGDRSQRAAKHAQPATRRARIARIALPPPAVHTTRQERQRVSGRGRQPPSALFDLRARTYRVH